MAPDPVALRDAALALALEERLELAHELQLSVAGDEEKLAALRVAIQRGDDALARGDYDEVPLDGVRAYLANKWTQSEWGIGRGLDG